MMEENQDAIVKAVGDDFRRAYVDTMLFEVFGVIAEINYFQKNLESLAKKEKLPTPLNLKPLSFEVQPSALYISTHHKGPMLFLSVLYVVI